MSYHIEERDPKTGRITKPSADCVEVLVLGRKFNWASPYRRMCAKCRRIAMRGSDFCWSHDPEYRKRRAQLAIASNDPDRIAKAFARKHRATMQAIWYRDPWFNGTTIWFTPKIEIEFRAACAHAALPLEELSPLSADILRWQWRFSRLDRDDWPAWERAIVRTRRREQKVGPPPGNWRYQPQGSQTPGPPITVVERSTPIHRHRNATKNWTPKMKATLRKFADAGAGTGNASGAAENVERVEAFLGEHQRDLRDVFQRLGHAAGDQGVRNRVARAYARMLRGELEGYRAMNQLLRQVEQGGRRQVSLS